MIYGTKSQFKSSIFAATACIKRERGGLTVSSAGAWCGEFVIVTSTSPVCEL